MLNFLYMKTDPILDLILWVLLFVKCGSRMPKCGSKMLSGITMSSLHPLGYTDEA